MGRLFGSVEKFSRMYNTADKWRQGDTVVTRLSTGT